MAVTLGTVGTDNETFGDFVEATITTSGTDRFVLAAVIWGRNAVTVSAVGYNSVAMTLIGNVTDPGGTRRASFYGTTTEPAATTAACQALLSGASSEAVSLIAWPFAGVNQAAPTSGLESDNGTISPDPQPTLGIASAVGDMVVDAFVCDDTAVTVLGGGQVQDLNNGSGGSLLRAGSHKAGAAGDVTMGWENLANFTVFGHIALNVQAAVAASPDNIVYRPIYRVRLHKYL